MTPIRVLSLFDGISCGQVALHRAGIPVSAYYASEIEPRSIMVTQHHYPATIQVGDVTKIDYGKLPEIDLIIGGSPCQGFSTSGRRRGFDDPRSGLIREFFRGVRVMKPKFYLLENVMMRGGWVNRISDELGVSPIQINSRLVSAQNRPRLYWTNISGVTQPPDRGIELRSILEDLPMTRPYHPGKFKSNFGTPMGSRKFPTIGCRDRRLCDANSEFCRNLTMIERERLQTLPDGYTHVPGVTKTDRVKMTGNCWTVDVIAHILGQMRFLEDVK